MNQTTENERRVRSLLNWFLNGETGLSSIAIVRAWACDWISDGPSWDHPRDAGDLRRCVQLLEECPFIDVTIMRGKSIYWDSLLDHWDLLMQIYMHELEMTKAEMWKDANMTYCLMKALFEIAEYDEKRANNAEDDAQNDESRQD